MSGDLTGLCLFITNSKINLEIVHKQSCFLCNLGNNSTVNVLANTTGVSSTNQAVTNLLGSDLTTSISQKDVNNYLAMAIIATIIAVRSDYYLGITLFPSDLGQKILYAGVLLVQLSTNCNICC